MFVNKYLCYIVQHALTKPISYKGIAIVIQTLVKKKTVKGELFSMTRAWDKEKI